LAEKNTSQQITQDDGPFSYTYIAVMGVPGIRLADSERELQLFSSPELKATAMLTNNWDKFCHHTDRSSAISLGLLTAFRGRSRFWRLSSLMNNIRLQLFGIQSNFERNLARQERKIRENRNKSKKSPGCYLVYKAEGDLIDPPRLHVARKVGIVGFGFDIIDGRRYRSIHKAALHGVATALSLVIEEGTGSPEINSITDAVYLNGKGGLTIYPQKIEESTVSVVTSKSLSSAELDRLSHYIPLIVSDHRIEVAISLFVQSHRRDGDNLRAFIAAWSALELLVNRLAKVIRLEWENLLQNAKLPAWDKNLCGVAPEDYRMRDRFYSVACTLDVRAAKADCEKFRQANDSRSGYYHRGDIQEKELPTNDVQSLFLKYFGLWLQINGK
jgi:hypothetical protein